MAEVVNNTLAGASMGSMTAPGGPRIEMVRNPEFSFPMQAPVSLRSRPNLEEESSRRPASMHNNQPPSQSLANAHKRAASTLPSFTFNADSTSGRDETPPETPTEDESAPITPSRRGHRRGGSEFVGGDSRLGLTNALSSSPTKTNALPLPVPSSGPPSAGRRGHAHRRSAAMSSHDVSGMMQPAEPLPRLSHSLPNTPMELPGQAPPLDRSASAPAENDGLTDPFGPPLDDLPTRPPSRPRVGFDDNVTIIPRPLSTISSETESSISTMRGHSYNNSISSVISMGTPSPPASRTPRTSLNATVEEDSSRPRAKSSLEISKRIEKEGEWLKSRSSGSLKRPRSEMIMPSQTPTFIEPETPPRARPQHNKKHSIGHALGFDRRRSEPAIGVNGNDMSTLSALSLQDDIASPLAHWSRHDKDPEHMSSARKIKQWAASKISRKHKEPTKALTASSSGSSLRPVTSESNIFVPGKVQASEPAVAETNLDAVFSSEGIASEARRPGSQARAELSTPTPSQHSSFYSSDVDDPGTMLDLDAALGPFKTPPIGSHRQRKELHSNRLNKDFYGPGGHYHRRTESAPALPPFEGARLNTPSQSSMADVFEEEEEEDSEANPHLRPDSIAASAKSGAEDESNVGVEIVDLDTAEPDTAYDCQPENGLGIQRVEWEPERPSTSYGNINSRLSTSGMEIRPSSVLDETIIEEASPIEPIDIVEAHEEPRASSLTKSSDSSDTPTVLAAPTGLLTLPDGTIHASMTPDTFQTSTFSSPDFAQRQTSFDTSRVGTSASSIADNRTMSSYATGDQTQDLRVSVDDVPSLTSSRSTMLSTANANTSRRDFHSSSRTPSATSGAVDPIAAAERRRKRSSIQSLSQLMGGSFGSIKSRSADELRPYTAVDGGGLEQTASVPKRKEHRLKKLMFWRSKHGATTG